MTKILDFMSRNTKVMVALILLLTMVILATGCAAQQVTGNRVTWGKDVQYFDYAYIVLGDRIIAEGQVKQWRDYDNSDTVQVMIGDKYYLTHYTNVVLCASAYNEVQYSTLSE